MIEQKLFQDVWLDELNPIVGRELAKMSWLTQRHSLRGYVRKVVLVIITLATEIWYISVVTSPNSPRSCLYNCSKSPSGFAGAAGAVINLFLIVGLLVSFFTDLYYISLSIGPLMTERANGTWDLLQLTELPEAQIIAAKYAVTQVRAWQLTAIEFGVRLAGVVVILLTMVSYSVLSPRDFSLFSQYYPDYIVLLMLTGTVYVLEPIWRMRLVVSIGLAVALRSNNLTSGLLSGLGALIVMRILQIIVLGSIFFGLFAFLRWVAPTFLGKQTLFDCVAIVMLGVFLTIVYLFHYLSRRYLLWWTVRLAARVQ